MAKNVVSSLNLGPQIFFHGLYLYCILDIVASYHCMEFQGKLTNQTWENGKKPSFVTDFDTCGPNLGPKYFFIDSTSTSHSTLLQAITVCNFKEN